jgi:hypothetical protein
MQNHPTYEYIQAQRAFNKAEAGPKWVVEIDIDAENKKIYETRCIEDALFQFRSAYDKLGECKDNEAAITVFYTAGANREIDVFLALVMKIQRFLNKHRWPRAARVTKNDGPSFVVYLILPRV